MIDFAFTIAAAISSGITGGMAVYAATRDSRVKAADAERKHWELRHDEARNEIHQIRDEWQSDKLELERLRTETNFAPLEKKLDGFIISQTQVNIALSQNLKVLTELMGRLVPELSKDEEKRQEEKL